MVVFVISVLLAWLAVVHLDFGKAFVARVFTSSEAARSLDHKRGSEYVIDDSTRRD